MKPPDAQRGTLASRLWARTPKLPLAASCIAVGFLLLVAASLPAAELVGVDHFSGSASPGVTLLPVSRTDTGAVAFQAEELPCPVFIHPLSRSDYARYVEFGDLPRDALNCEERSGTRGEALTHFLIRNVDPTDSMNYSFHVRYYRLTQPYGWLIAPGGALLLFGTVLATFRLLQRGVDRLVRDLDGKDRKSK